MKRDLAGQDSEAGTRGGLFPWNNIQRSFRYAILRAATWVFEKQLKGRPTAICGKNQAILIPLDCRLITSKNLQERRNYHIDSIRWNYSHCD